MAIECRCRHCTIDSKQEAFSNPGRPIRIDGDEMARYQDIVHVLDLCQFEGFTRISMHTRQ